MATDIEMQAQMKKETRAKVENALRPNGTKSLGLCRDENEARGDNQGLSKVTKTFADSACRRIMHGHWFEHDLLQLPV